MIRSRRQLHRRVFLGLAFIVPIMLAVTLFGRPTVPPVAAFDDDLRRLAGFSDQGEYRRRVIDAGPHRYEVESHERSDDGVALNIRPQSVIPKPDLLVYWTPRNEDGAELSEDAVLVGSLSGTSRRTLRLPPAADAGQGTLIVYSLAHQEVVDRFPLRLAIAPDERGE